jgi:hypothetical protein
MESRAKQAAEQTLGSEPFGSVGYDRLTRCQLWPDIFMDEY